VDRSESRPERIVDALKERDAASAAGARQEHLDRVERVLEAWFATTGPPHQTAVGWSSP